MKNFTLKVITDQIQLCGHEVNRYVVTAETSDGKRFVHTLAFPCAEIDASGKLQDVSEMSKNLVDKLVAYLNGRDTLRESHWFTWEEIYVQQNIIL